MRVAPDKLDHSENVGVALSQNLLAPVAATVTLYSTGVVGISIKDQADVIADAPEVAKGSSTDDDLTSLTWLQDKNLLKGVRQLPKNETGTNKTASTTDAVVIPTECAFKPTDSFEMSKCKDEDPVPFSYDPQVHIHAKPPFSFSCLIFMAIEDSSLKALPVRDIYLWIIEHFPYYRNAPTGWKNSVRHNLSLNKCFKKADKPLNLGKGSLWMVEQRHRTALIQALRKSPYQYNKFLRNLKVSPETGSEANGIKNEASENIVHIQSYPNYSIKSAVAAYTRDPMELYRRGETLDDVHAAEAMLVLKHGASALDAFNITPDCLTNLSVANSYQPSAAVNGYIVEERNPSVTSYPSEDHNYVNDTRLVTAINGARGNTGKMTTAASYLISSSEDAEERRKIAEGADALLNLAGVRTYNTRKRYVSCSSSDENFLGCPGNGDDGGNGGVALCAKRTLKRKRRESPTLLESSLQQQSSPSMMSDTVKTDDEETESDVDTALVSSTSRNGDQAYSVTKDDDSRKSRDKRSFKTVINNNNNNNASYVRNDQHNTEDDDTETASEEEGAKTSNNNYRKKKKNAAKNGDSGKMLQKISLRRTTSRSAKLSSVTTANTNSNNNNNNNNIDQIDGHVKSGGKRYRRKTR